MRITVQLQLRQYDFPLKMLPMFLEAYWWGIQVPHPIAPAHYLLPHSSNSVVAQIVTAMQLPRMLKVTHCTVGRFGRNSKFFGSMGYYYFIYLWGYDSRAPL